MPLPFRPRSASWTRTLGPGAMIAAAYVDPGNVATNTEAGGRYGPALLWVVAAARGYHRTLCSRARSASRT